MTGTHALILLFPRSVVPSLICYLALRLGGRWPAFGVCWRLADRFLGFSVSLCAWVVDGQRLAFVGAWPIDHISPTACGLTDTIDRWTDQKSDTSCVPFWFLVFLVWSTLFFRPYYKFDFAYWIQFAKSCLSLSSRLGGRWPAVGLCWSLADRPRLSLPLAC